MTSLQIIDFAQLLLTSNSCKVSEVIFSNDEDYSLFWILSSFNKLLEYSSDSILFATSVEGYRTGL